MSDTNEYTGNTRPYSSTVVDGDDRAPSRAMLYAVGFEKDDFQKPQVAIASTWSQVTPCNMHIDKLAVESAKGADAAGGKSLIFNTITISDGISMGTEGMKYSLVSREVIADSIETVVGCEGMDGALLSSSTVVLFYQAVRISKARITTSMSFLYLRLLVSTLLVSMMTLNYRA